MKKRKTIYIIGTTLAIIIIGAGGILIFSKNKTQTAASYEDAEGWVYRCSQPVKVKYKGVTYANGTPSPTPVDPSEASKYCHRIGIE